MLYSSPLPYQSDASAYFAALRDLPWPAWLDSGGSGRYDILVAQPVSTLVTQGEQTEIRDSSGVRYSADDPFALVRKELGEQIAPMPEVPFAGGALGYWSYDLARRYHPIPSIAQDAEQLPEMVIGIYDWAVVLDHQELSARLVSRQRYPATAKVLPQILGRLGSPSSPAQSKAPFCVKGTISSNFTFAAYREAFDVVQQYLQAGDCYQINLAQRFVAQASGDAFEAYLELRQIESGSILGFS